MREIKKDKREGRSEGKGQTVERTDGRRWRRRQNALRLPVPLSLLSLSYDWRPLSPLLPRLIRQLKRRLPWLPGRHQPYNPTNTPTKFTCRTFLELG